MKHILYELLVFLRLKKRTIPNDNEILGYFRMFYLFLSAGMLVKESLEQCKVTVSPLMQPITKKILSKMDNGYNLELAMQETKVFPKYITDLVEAGRKNGSLKDIALEIIFFLEQKIDIKRKVNSGLFIVKIMSFILVVLIVAAFIVINKFKEILNDTKGELPTFTKLVLDFGDIVSNNWYIILFFVIVLLISFKILKKQYREKFDSLMFKVPIYGPIYKNLSFYRMSRIMSLTVQTGIAVEDSFEYASLAVDNIYCDVLPPLSLSLRSGGFLFDTTFVVSISKLSPCIPRFFIFYFILRLFSCLHFLYLSLHLCLYHALLYNLGISIVL